MGKDKSKRGKEDFSKFDGFGVDFKCKLIGIMDVPAPRGDDICQDAMTKLTAIALKNNKQKKEHKQKITVNITFKGIRLLDEGSEKIEHAHPIQRISFISHDDNDKRTFGYIVGTKEGYKLFAIKAMKEAEEITKTLKELFQEVFEKHQAEKQRKLTEETEETVGTEITEKQDNTEVETAEEVEQENADPFLVDFGQLNEQIQAMQNDGGMIKSSTQDMLSDFVKDDPFGGDNFTAPPAAQQQQADPFNQQHQADPFNQQQQADPFNQQQQADPFNQQKQADPFNPFGEAPPVNQNTTNTASVDFFAPQPNSNGTAMQRNPSEDLFALNTSVSTTAATKQPTNLNNDTTDAPLLINDPIAQLKKNIDVLHMQNQMQQQQQPPFGFQSNFNQPNPFSPQGNVFNAAPVAPNPFGNATNPPVLPPRPAPGGVNPFMGQTQAPAEADMGWTVNTPTPAPRTDIKKTVITSGDPFAFLNHQTGTNTSQPANGNVNVNSNASNDIFDLLG